MNKNITDKYQTWIYDQIKKPPEKEEIKILDPDDQKLFTHLCRLQQEDLFRYQIVLAFLRESNTL